MTKANALDEIYGMLLAYQEARKLTNSAETGAEGNFIEMIQETLENIEENGFTNFAQDE